MQLTFSAIVLVQSHIVCRLGQMMVDVSLAFDLTVKFRLMRYNFFDV
jgi:hypothetical protein